MWHALGSSWHHKWKLKGGTVSWLVLHVKLTGLRDAQRALFLGAPVRNRLAFELMNWVRKIHPPQCRCIIQFAEGLNRTKMWKKDEFAFSAWAETSIFSYSQISVLLGIWTWMRTYIICSSGFQASGEDWIIPLAFMVLQFAAGRSWEFLVSICMSQFL